MKLSVDDSIDLYINGNQFVLDTVDNCREKLISTLRIKNLTIGDREGQLVKKLGEFEIKYYIG